MPDDGMLGKEIAAINPQQNIVWVVGSNKMLPHFRMFLQQAMQPVEELMVFQSTIQSSSVEPKYNGILFSDIMSVDSFFVLNTIPANTVAFCINEHVAQYLTQKLVQPTVVVQAAQPSILSLIETVIVYYNR